MPPTRTSSEQTAAEIAESILAWDFSDQREKPPFVVQMTKVAQGYLAAEQRAERLREFVESVERGCFDCVLGSQARRLLDDLTLE